MKTSERSLQWTIQDILDLVLEPNVLNVESIQEELGRTLLPGWPTAGFIYPNRAKPGCYSWTGYDDNRRRLEASDVRCVDSQAELPSSSVEPIHSRDAQPIAGPAVGDTALYEVIIRNSAALLEDRVAALQEWIIVDNDAAACFIAEELCRSGSNARWRDALIYAAEDVRFPSQDDQRRVCSRLRELALELRNDTTTGLEQVVWSALRRFASLVPEEEAGSLAVFLDHRGVVDTRLVGLQSVICVFEIAPPKNSTILSALADRVYGLAVKLIDPDVITPGETSAIAEQAIHTLAALGDSRVGNCLKRLEQLGWNWLAHQVHEDLVQLREGWKTSDPAIRTHAAFIQIDSILNSWK